jgi:hypothetical protein
MLRHPGIVQVHEFGEVDGEYYLAMELVDGSDLREVNRLCLERGLRPPVGVVAYIISEIAGALAYAHALTDENQRPLGIVHRDVSPSNIMVASLGTVKLVDFGIAHAEDHIRGDQTRTSIGLLKGKLSYLSPEQVEGRPVDARSDLFALGIVFHELLTGRRLFRAQGAIESMRLVREAELTPPSAVVEGIPPEVDAVVMKLLARSSEDRFQTGEAVVTALRPIVRSLEGESAALRRFLRDLGPIGPRANPQSRPHAQGTRSRTSTLAGSYGEARQVTPIPPSGALRESRTVWMVTTAVVVAAATLLGQVSFRNRPASPVPAAPRAPVMAARPAAPTVIPPAERAPATPARSLDTTPAPALEPAAPEAAGRVRLSVTGTEGAEVVVDGMLVGTVPLQIALPRIDATRHVVVRRAGYKRWTADVDGTQDAALLAPLIPTTTKPKPRGNNSGGADLPLYRNPFK